jgi:uncharacterized protein YndB with AHSA1/START domain
VATTAITPEGNAVVSEIEIAAPPARVFQALTQPDQLMRWWRNEVCTPELWEVDARPGGRWRCKQKSTTMTINGRSEFEIAGEIVEIEPPRLLVYTWTATWDQQPSSSVVRWELTPNGKGTKVKVTHSGLAPELAKDYSGGWPDVVGRLRNFAEK